MTTPTYTELVAAHHAAETARIALAAELDDTRRALYRAEQHIRLPHLAPVLALVQGSTREEFIANANALDAALTAARAQHRA